MHSKKIHDNYDQFDTKVQWTRQRFEYNPTLSVNARNYLHGQMIENFSHFKMNNSYFIKKSCLYLETPLVKVLHVKPNLSRLRISGYHLFVKSEELKRKLMKIIRNWHFLDSLDRNKVSLQFTNYAQDYWNEKEITVFEFDKYLRGRNQWLLQKTSIYKKIMENVGIGIDYNPHRLWPKHAKIIFEFTMHTLKDMHSRNLSSYIRIVAREIDFL